QNVAKVRELWPAPERIVEAGGSAIGYVRDVIFPLQVVAQDAGRPVTLHLKLNYRICDNDCSPADANVELAVVYSPATLDVALALAERRVPKKVALGEGGSLAIRLVRREDGPVRPRVIVDVAAPAGSALDLFAEGPTPHWALPLPEKIDGAQAGMQRFAF